MNDKKPALVLIVGKHSFEVDPNTDPDVQRIRSEVVKYGSWQAFMRAVNDRVKN
jgi:hypothetical protein